jgi:hypothetical protein
MSVLSSTLANKALTEEVKVTDPGLPVQFSQATAEGEPAISLRPLTQVAAGKISYRTITW